MADVREQGVASSAARRGSAAWPLILMLALFALALLLVHQRQQPPAARPPSIPPAEFSGERAREVLRQLVGDGRPHPVGSAADDRVRRQIVDVLAGLGLAPRIEEGFTCSASGTCARVRNVVARLGGREADGAVALTAHYDSVPAGPGASDDLAGVAAILEIARALRSGPPPRRPVLVLLDEGEEMGLLGARVFEETSGEAAEVKAVVNLEARGTGGASFMFETSGDNGWLIEAWAPRVPRPATTSLAAFIYSLLPNSTDLAIFRRYRVPGLNFAYIGDATRYHTSADNFANASPASLQHQGDNALAAVKGLADADQLVHPPPGNVAFFDLFSLGIVRLPLGWTLGLAVAGLLLLLFAAVTSMARRTAGGGDVVLGLLAAPATLLATALLAYGLALGLRAAGIRGVVWLAHPLPALAAFWLLAFCLAVTIAWMLGKGSRTAPLGLWLGIWLIWAVVGLALAVRVPATSYLFVLPALAAGICGLLARVWRGGPAGGGGLAAAAIVPGVAAAVLWWGVLPPVYGAMGVPVLAVIATLLAVLFSTLAPLVAAAGARTWRLAALAGALAVVGALAALAQPLATQESPRPLSFNFYQDGDSGLARWAAIGPPPLPPQVWRAAAFGPPGPVYPWWPPQARYVSAAAPPLAAASAPELQVLESTVTGGRRHLRLRLVSRRGAAVGRFMVPARAHPTAVRIDGHPLPEGERRGPAGTSDWLAFSDVTLPAAGFELDLMLDETGPLDVYGLDTSFGLPPGGAGLLAARPPEAVPLQDGDITVVSRRLRIGGPQSEPPPR
jgi:hypothetical protein